MTRGLLVAVCVTMLIACGGQPTAPEPTGMPPTAQVLATSTPPTALSKSAPTSTARPQAQSALSKVAGHPRLFFNAADWATVRAKANTTHKATWDIIRQYADQALSESPPAIAPATGTLADYRIFSGRLLAVSFACVVEDKYCPEARKTALTYANWEQWGEDNARDLGHGQMLAANALAYDWLYPRLTPEERTTLRTSLGKWAERMYEAATAKETVEAWRNWWRQALIQNHHWVAHSGLGMAALALMDEDPRATRWLGRAQSQMSHVRDLLEGIGDGTWHEGIHYQTYALTLALPFWVNLKRLTNVDLIPHQYLRNYARWRLYNHLPDTYHFIMAYGDFDWSWDNGLHVQNLLRFCAAQYEDGYAEWLAQAIDRVDDPVNPWQAPYAVYQFFYQNPAVQARSPEALPKYRTFPDLAGVIWRTGWGKDDLVFGFKTGAYGGKFAQDTFVREVAPWDAPCTKTDCALHVGHDHADVNTFYLYRGGAWLAPEAIGVDKTQTSFHNTILIDGEGSFYPSGGASKDPRIFSGTAASLQTVADSLNFNFLVADATASYKNIKGMQNVSRRVLFVRPGYFIMLDNLAGERPRTYQWTSHFDGRIAVEQDWIRGNYWSEQGLSIQVIRPSHFMTETGDDGKPFVRVQPAQKTKSARFITLLLPTQPEDWPNRPSATDVAESPNAVFMRVKTPDAAGGRTDDIWIASQTAAGSTVVGGYRFDGEVAVVQRDANGNIMRLFTVGGSALFETTTNQELISGLAQSTSAGPVEVNFVGEEVRVVGSLPPNARLYAPKAARVWLNDIAQSFRREGDMITLSQ